jgi:hypothetical protein
MGGHRAMKQREGFNFYRSYFDVLDMMNKEEQLDFLIALLEKQFYGTEPSLKGQAKFAYISQKHSIDRQVEGWENKTKCKLQHPTEEPSLPPTEPPYLPPTQPPSLQVEEEGKEEVEVEKTILKSYSFVEDKISDDDMELFTIMFAEFGEKDNVFDELFDMWIKLTIQEQNDSVRFAKNYIKYQTSRKKEISLFFYLKDKKYNWTTIRK